MMHDQRKFKKISNNKLIKEQLIDRISVWIKKRIFISEHIEKLKTENYLKNEDNLYFEDCVWPKLTQP